MEEWQVALLVAAIGLGGVLLGALASIIATVLTNLWTDRREESRWQKQESVRWLTDRRATYARFLAECQRLTNATRVLPPRKRDDPETVESLRADTRQANEFSQAMAALILVFHEVRLIGTAPIRNAALAAFDALTDLANATNENPRDEAKVNEARSRAHSTQLDFTDAARDDLGIVDKDTTVWDDPSRCETKDPLGSESRNG